ncbi:MAG TPA: THUMP domain-containing protein [Candidatus Bathyarchaeia archaeon]|nr:THUMP domain-containing protein [Candidatus Bathyarchaeia archaeon]
MEEEAVNEISEFLQDVGDADPKVEISEFSGIVTACTSLNPFDVIIEIRKKILDEPWSVRYCHRFIPIQETIMTDLDDIVKAVQKHINKMKSTDSYRITIEKRGSDLSSKDMIDSIAKIIHNKVSLEKFDWNIIIEVLGKISGISILKESDIVSTLKIKRDSME